MEVFLLTDLRLRIDLIFRCRLCFWRVGLYQEEQEESLDEMAENSAFGTMRFE
jgi:hypothetical protein